MSHTSAAQVALTVAFVLALTAGTAAAIAGAPVSGEITVETNSGVAVSTTDHGGEMVLTGIFASDSQVELITANGNLTVSGADADLRVENIDGQVEVPELAVTGGTVTIDPPGRDALTVSGDATATTLYDAEIGGSERDIRLAGPSGGDATVTVRGLAPNERVAIVEPQNGRTVAVVDTDSSGALTATLPTGFEYLSIVASDAEATSTPASQVTPVQTPAVSNPLQGFQDSGGTNLLTLLLSTLVGAMGGDQTFGLLFGGTTLLAFWLAGNGDLAVPTILLVLAGPLLWSLLPGQFVGFARGLLVIGIAAGFLEIGRRYVLNPGAQ
jgi:hypothetical protein